jgi:hypothetical protein
MGIRRARAVMGVAAVMVFGAIAVPAASADSLVYMKDGNVWISHGDGSNARQVTGGPNTWSWPTEDDAGNILVAGGQGSVSAGMEDSAGSEIYRLNQQGASLSDPAKTPGSFSTPSCPTYPPASLRVAPDGQHYAYYSWFCDHFITEIGTVGGGAFTSSEYMSDFEFPYWVDNGDFVVSRGSVPFQDSDGMWWTHDLGDKINYGYNWFGDPASYAEPFNDTGWATGFDGVAVSRDGTKVATLEEDSANWTSGAAHKVVIRVWSAGGAPTPAHETVPTPTPACDISLPADPNLTMYFDNSGPTFSPDGSKLAFAEPDGIHIANTSNVSNCASVASAPLAIPGATEPSWSNANEAANAGWVPPNNGNNGGNNGNNNGNNGNQGDKTPPVLSELSIQPKRFAAAKTATAMSARKKKKHTVPQGAVVRYTLSEPAKVSFTVEQLAQGRKKGSACVKPTQKLRHAKRCALIKNKGTLTRSGVSGGDQLVFSGRLGTRKLAPGSYELVAQAADAAGNKSSTGTIKFTIVKG